jgi:hypothetical protein
MVTLLGAPALAQARAFIVNRARPLEQARFRFLFESGQADDVLHELAAFQNDDGGFGQALEPDARGPVSTPVATQHAFALFRELGTGPEHPMVMRAVAYLVESYDRHRQLWEIVPPEIEAAPHAPWWTYAGIMDTFHGCRLNPTAGLLGALQDYPTLVDQDLRDELTRVVLKRLAERRAALESDELRSVVWLAECERLDPTLREEVRGHAAASIGMVELDPVRWADYRLQPLEVAPFPSAFLTGVLDPTAIQRNLDYWVRLQQTDGGWPITWSWADVDEQAWACAEAEWRGQVTVERLVTLRAYFRLER